MIKRTTLFAAASLLAHAAPAYSQAQAPAEAPAEEEVSTGDIVVTAQRRVERVQDVPVAVTVVSDQQLAQQRINSIADLTKVSASLQLNQNPGGSGGGGYIRGLGTFSRSRSAEPSVGIVVDGVVQGLTNVRNLSDVSRLEVLRGPQGTLFGQSVSAGVINITTPEPSTNGFSGKASVELSSDGFAGSEFGKQTGRLALNVPLSSNVAVRVSGYGANTRGVLENALTGRMDFSHEYGTRGRLKGEFGPLTVNLIGEYSYQENGGGGGFATAWRILDRTGVDITNDPTKSRTAQLYAVCGLKPSIENMENCSDGRSIQQFKTQGYSLQLDFDGGPVQLTSITAYRKLDSVTQNDIDQLPQDLGSSQQQSGLATNYRQFTQELRAATDPTNPVSLTFGGFYYRSTMVNRAGPTFGVVSRDYQQRGLLPIATCWPVATVAACSTFVAPAARNTESGQDTVNENLSGFGEVKFKSDKFTAFAGARLTSAKIVQTGFNGATLSDNRFSDTNLSGRLGVQYEFNRDVMAYATFATGYKSAQVAPIQGALAASVVKPEKPTSYEIGLKTSLLNRALNFNVDAFYSKISGYQTSKCDVVNNLVQCVPANLPEVISKGFEADLFGRITPDWTVNATAMYNKIVYPAGFLADNNTSLAGKQLLAAPRFAATFGTDYAFPLGDVLKGFVSADVSYTSRVRLATTSNSDDYTYKGHSIVGGRIGVRVDKSWSVAVFADNIFGQNDPGSMAAIVSQYPDNATSANGLPAGTPFGVVTQSVLQTSRSLRQVGIQAQLTF